MQGVGLSVDPGYIECYEGTVPITTLKYQYYIHDNIRVVPSLMMGAAVDGGFSINPYIKADVFLTQISKFRVYASAGIGYAYVSEYEEHGNYFSYLLGIGVEWRVAYNWTIQLSGNFDGLAGTYKDYQHYAEYELESDYGFGGHLSLGFVYNF
jgi:opacity protein-like surface antigen